MLSSASVLFLKHLLRLVCFRVPMVKQSNSRVRLNQMRTVTVTKVLGTMLFEEPIDKSRETVPVLLAQIPPVRRLMVFPQ